MLPSLPRGVEDSEFTNRRKTLQVVLLQKPHIRPGNRSVTKSTLGVVLIYTIIINGFLLQLYLTIAGRVKQMFFCLTIVAESKFDQSTQSRIEQLAPSQFLK